MSCLKAFKINLNQFMTKGVYLTKIVYIIKIMHGKITVIDIILGDMEFFKQDSNSTVHFCFLKCDGLLFLAPKIILRLGIDIIIIIELLTTHGHAVQYNILSTTVSSTESSTESSKVSSTVSLLVSTTPTPSVGGISLLIGKKLATFSSQTNPILYITKTQVREVFTN